MTAPMTAMDRYGDPDRFEIAIRWIGNTEPRARRPTQGGWSTGDLKITAGGLVLTRHHYRGRYQDHLSWYLAPLFAWFADNWVHLFHEEKFSWVENSALPAAGATLFALRRNIGATDPEGRQDYARTRAWWQRHALRSADSSALLPDLFVRRLTDQIELSWTARQPAFPPDGFRLDLTPGSLILPVEDVAGPIWQALSSIAQSGGAGGHDDRAELLRFQEEQARLSRLGAQDLEAEYLSTRLHGLVAAGRQKHGLEGRSVFVAGAPAIARFDDAVLMFGGGDPNLSAEDVDVLIGHLAALAGGRDSDALNALVDSEVTLPSSAPFEEGYQLAESLLDRLGLADRRQPIDIPALMQELDIRTDEKHLTTTSIRGVAVAGEGYSPAILVNTSSSYNRTGSGRRFTLAHELFHILYDRSRARRIAHISGRWAPPGIEKRANAFAAMLLMPTAMLRREFASDRPDIEDLKRIAERLDVSISALVEHIYNISLIDDVQRDSLRGELAQSRVP